MSFNISQSLLRWPRRRPVLLVEILVSVVIKDLHFELFFLLHRKCRLEQVFLIKKILCIFKFVTLFILGQEVHVAESSGANFKR